MSPKKSSGSTIHAAVDCSVKRQWDAFCDETGLRKQDLLGYIVTLYLKLPRETQLAISEAMRDDERFRQLMLAVDRAVAERIRGEMPLSDETIRAMIGRGVRSAGAAPEGTEPGKQSKKRSSGDSQ